MNLMIKIFPYKNVGIIYKSDTGRESVLYYNQGSLARTRTLRLQERGRSQNEYDSTLKWGLTSSSLNLQDW